MFKPEDFPKLLRTTLKNATLLQSIVRRGDLRIEILYPILLDLENARRDDGDFMYPSIRYHSSFYGIKIRQHTNPKADPIQLVWEYYGATQVFPVLDAESYSLLEDGFNLSNKLNHLTGES